MGKQQTRMNRLFLFDVESTGLDPAAGDCIEVGAVVFSLKHMAVVKCYSTVLRTGRGNDAEHVNHIPAGLLEEGTPVDGAWATMDAWAKQCEYVVGHNCEFDKGWVPSRCESMLSMTWLDTCQGMTWPQQSRPAESLISLCLDHGIGVVDPHRALNDCLLLSLLLRRVKDLGHDVEAILAQDLRPKATFEALVDYADRQLASDQGFKWDRDTRKWTRKMAVDDAAKLAFKVRRLTT